MQVDDGALAGALTHSVDILGDHGLNEPGLFQRRQGVVVRVRFGAPNDGQPAKPRAQ